MNSFLLSIGASSEEGEQNQEIHAVYYYYDFGTLMNPPQDWSPGESDGWDGWNMARKGRDIYQRPLGVWYDSETLTDHK